MDEHLNTGEDRVGRRRRITLAIAAVAGTVGLAAIPAVASAQTGDGSSSDTAATAEAIVDDTEHDDLWEEPSAEELAEYQGIEERLAESLDAAGIAYEWVEEDGFRYVEVDWEDDAAVEAVDDFFREAFPLSPEDIAEMNRETEELIAALREAGVPVTATTDEDGFVDFEIDSEDDATLEAAERVFAELYGDEFGELEDCDLLGDDEHDIDDDDLDLDGDEEVAG